MLPRGLGAVFLHGGAAGGHVETWRWVGHLRKYRCASSQRRGMGRPASGSLGAQIRIQSVAQNWLLAVTVILPMVVPRHLVHTRNEPGCCRRCSSLHVGQEFCKRTQLICLRKEEENACVEARKLHGSEARFVLRRDCVRAPLRRPTTGRMI